MKSAKNIFPKRFLMIVFLCIQYSIINLQYSFAQNFDSLKVLIVIAHPDDESAVAATVYKITHELKGKVDMCLISDGEGGYKYSTLAESIYGIELTDEKIGRENLPRIRKMELMNAGKILGIRDYFFLDQIDSHYGTDEREPIDTSWNIPFIKKRLTEIMTITKYDYVFCVLPVPGTHGGHKAATILALRTIKDLPEKQRPIIFGCNTASKADTVRTQFSQLKDYTETKIRSDLPPFILDRTTKFGYNKSLDYKIIVNWEIAEHKSQGTMQTFMNQGDYEQFWYFAINPDAGIEKVRQLFERLKVVPYPAKTY